MHTHSLPLPLAYTESLDSSKDISQQDRSEKSTIAPHEVTSINNFTLGTPTTHFDLFFRFPSAIL
jgi:hypothetical protein